VEAVAAEGNSQIRVGSDFLAAVAMKISIFWDVTHMQTGGGQTTFPNIDKKDTMDCF
jgi:uncharacterized protein (DUF2345 family)